jgi:hypothetical protein
MGNTMRRSKLSVRLFVIGIAAAMLAAVGRTARADWYHFVGVDSKATLLQIYKSGASETVYTGPYLLKIADTQPHLATAPTQYVFCVDIFDSISPGNESSFTKTTVESSLGNDVPNPPPPLGGTNGALQAGYLASKYLPQISSQNSAHTAALGAAMWEITQDGTLLPTDNLTNRLNHASGAGALFAMNFSSTAGSIFQLALGYLQEALNNYSTYDHGAFYTYNPQPLRQHFVYVPEPVFYQLACLLSLGGISLLKWRRRQTRGA